MNVLLVGPSKKEKGGISTVINNLYELGIHEDIEFEVYSSWKNNSRTKKFFYYIYQLLYFPLFLSRTDFHIIYIHFAQGGSFYRKALYAIISKLLKKKVVLHSHSSSFDIFFKNKIRVEKETIRFFFNNFCEKLIVLGPTWKSFYKKEIKVNEDKLVILNNSVKTDINSIPYNVNSNIVTMFGLIGERKGIYDLLKIAEMFKIDKSDIQFIIYGNGEVEKVQGLIDKKDLYNVSLGGWVTGEMKRKAFSESALNILLSYHEGMPLSILETMSCGIPNIGTKVGEIPKLIVEGENGYLVNPGNIDQMYEKIKNYFSLHENSKRNMSDLAKRKIANEYNYQRFKDELNEILSNV